MITRRHPLVSPSPGTTRELLSLHYGPTGTGRKAAIQASLHADEVPGLLVAHHLRRRLAGLETAGALRGEIVLVPFANPIGLSQRVLQSVEGRFDLASGENFNRRYADLVPRACELLLPQLGGAATPTVAMVREALRQACAELPAATSSTACDARCSGSPSTPRSCSTCTATTRRYCTSTRRPSCGATSSRSRG